MMYSLLEPLELLAAVRSEPVIKRRMVFARGSADDKGQFYMRMHRHWRNHDEDRLYEYQYQIPDLKGKKK